MATTVFPNYLTTAVVTGKADKVSSATSGDFAGLDANGNLTDSGHKHSDYATKVSGTTTDRLASLDSSGNIANSGKKLSDLIQKSGIADQTIDGNGSHTRLYIAGQLGNNNKATVGSKVAGAYFTAEKGVETVTLRPNNMANDGTGYAEIYLDGASATKTFKFKQNGNFEDGNGLTLGGLNYEKAQEHTVAIVQKGSTASRNISANRYVIWDGSLYKTSTAITSGDTLSASNLTAVTDGGINELFLKLGYSNIGYNLVTDLNDVPEYSSGITFFRYENTADNKPSSYGGCGIYLGSWGYGVQIAYVNSTVNPGLYARTVSGIDSTPSFGSWKTFSFSS